jgi:signal transduction histidine kinase
MAVVPSVSVREGAPAGRAGDARLWRAWLAIALLVCLAWLVVPRGQVVLRELVLYPLVEAVAIAAIVVGVRRYRPSAPWAWLLIAAGFFSFWIGDILWGVYVVEGRDPFPSPADAFYLAGYPVIAAGLAIAWLRRRATVDRRAALDAGLVAVSGALVFWVYVIQPAIDDPSVSPWEKLVTIAYPVGDWLLLAVAARYVMGSSWNVWSFKLLVLGLVLTLVGDLLFSLNEVGRVSSNLDVVDTLLLLGVICVGLAGLHRSMPALTEKPKELVEGHETVRLVLIAIVALVPAAVLAIESAVGDPLDLFETIAAMVLIGVLATLRSTTVASEALQAAKRESLLSRYADELLRADGRDELCAVAERSANDLVGDGKASLVTPLGVSANGAEHAFSEPIEVRGETVAKLVADGSVTQIGRSRDALATVATQLALALERERLLATEREAADALTEQNERLRELDRMKDVFVSSVSHELRTPLTSISGYLELLLEGEAGDLTEEQRRFLNIVDRNSDRLNELIDDILVASRMDSGQFSLDRTSVDLVQLATRQVESIRATAERKQVEVRLTVEEGPPPLSADPMRLSQLLDNLLSNAVKFTPTGGRVGVLIGTRGETAYLDVSDTGVGIPADELDRLFERFFRASTSSTVKGTGLGLSIAKSIAEAHGGTISVESEVGIGTTFSVELPLRAQLDDAGLVADAGAAS